ncbi:Phox homologous domain-containing protein [Globomyces pollinis-pini]|nr:Phox homologous domain-containing protein [Globomyces pollinis-pini]
MNNTVECAEYKNSKATISRLNRITLQCTEDSIQKSVLLNMMPFKYLAPRYPQSANSTGSEKCDNSRKVVPHSASNNRPDKIRWDGIRRHVITQPCICVHVDVLPRQPIDRYTHYAVTVKILNGEVVEYVLSKRYREFKRLYNSLSKRYPKEMTDLHEFPQKTFFLRHESSKVIGDRAANLNRWLQSIYLHPFLAKCELVSNFITLK